MLSRHQQSSGPRLDRGREAGPRALEPKPDYKNNYSIQANLGIQRQITNNLSVEIAYQMYHGLIRQPVGLNFVKLRARLCGERDRLGNLALAARPRLGPLFRVCGADTNCGQVNDAGITQFTDYQSRGTSIYHGMTASLTRRFSNYVSFQGNYTFSKAIDDQTDFNRRLRRPSDAAHDGAVVVDFRHPAQLRFRGVFKAGSRAGLRGISLSPSVFIRSGIPFTLRTGADINGDTRGGTDRLFNIGRNTGMGPNYRKRQPAAQQIFPLQAGRAADRSTADAANLFNRTNFAAVNEIIPVSVSPNGILTFPNALSAADYTAGTVRLTDAQGSRLRRARPLSFTWRSIRGRFCSD